jgi:hypothetical protein
MQCKIKGGAAEGSPPSRLPVSPKVPGSIPIFPIFSSWLLLLLLLLSFFILDK